MYEQFIISSIFISTAFPTWEITLLLQSLSKDLSIAQRLHSFEHVRKTVLMWAGVWCRMQDVCLGPRPPTPPPHLCILPRCFLSCKTRQEREVFILNHCLLPSALHRCYVNSLAWFLPEWICGVKQGAFFLSLFCTKHNTFCDQSAWKIVCAFNVFWKHMRKWALWNVLNSIIDSHPTTEVVRRGIHK